MSEEPRVIGRPFQPGQSGNPEGRKKGSRNAATRLAEALIEGEAEELVKKAIEMAKNGDGPVLRAVLDRLAPARKDAAVQLDLPPVETVKDAKAASSAILAAVAVGDITPSEAASVMSLLNTHRAIVETEELEARIAALEARDK